MYVTSVIKQSDSIILYIAKLLFLLLLLKIVVIYVINENQDCKILKIVYFQHFCSNSFTMTHLTSEFYDF